MSTQNSLTHLREIIGVFGHALIIGGDSGPSYRAAYEKELGDLGVLWNMEPSTIQLPKDWQNARLECSNKPWREIPAALALKFKSWSMLST